MKRILVLAFLFFTLLGVASSQSESPEAAGGRLQAYKIAYLTRKLNLTPKEAERFWPVYNKYQDEIRSARISDRQQKKSEIDSEEKLLNIRKKYNGQFTKALDPEKVNTLYRSEKEFMSMVQKELLERRQQKLDNRKRKQ